MARELGILLYPSSKWGRWSEPKNVCDRFFPANRAGGAVWRDNSGQVSCADIAAIAKSLRSHVLEKHAHATLAFTLAASRTHVCATEDMSAVHRPVLEDQRAGCMPRTF